MMISKIAIRIVGLIAAVATVGPALADEEQPAPPLWKVLGYGEGAFTIGKLLHEDNFENLDNWVVQIEPDDGEPHPQLRVRDNTLDAYLPNRGATIWFRPKLEGQITVVYQVRAPTEPQQDRGVVPRDINVFWHASDPTAPAAVLTDPHYNGAFGRYHRMHGYYASIGGGGNTTTRFRRYPRQVDGRNVPHIALTDRDQQPDYLIKPDQTHTAQVVAFNDIIQFIVDGEVFYQIREGDTVNVEGGPDSKADLFPIHTEGWFGFRMTHTHHIFSNFRVYRLDPAQENPHSK